MAFIDLLFGALTAFVATSMGAAAVLLFHRHKDDSIVRRSKYSKLIAFCAGVMTFTAIEMFRESRMHAGAAIALGSALAGIFLFFVLEKGFSPLHFALRRKNMSHSGKKVALIVSAIAIHNIPEGFAIASAFVYSVPLGWFVTLSIALQDVPEGLLIAAPLVAYGIGLRRSFQFGALSGFIEGAAAIAGYALLTSSLLASMIPLALGLSAGVMICVVMKELLPDAFRSSPASAATYFVAGVLVALGIASAVLGF